MRLHVLWIIGFAFCLAGCGENERAAPEQAAETETAAPPPEPAAAEPAAPAIEGMGTADFIEHMHAHADQLDNINFALADGNLEGARTPAYWLARHEEIGAIPAELRPYVAGMREAASVLETAPDLDAARAAAERINEQCQGCHTATGVSAMQ